MKKAYIHYTPFVPFHKQFNCMSKEEKAVLALKKMKQGKTQYEAEDELRKENGFLIRREKEKISEQEINAKEEKVKNAKQAVLDLIIDANKKSGKVVNKPKGEFSYEEYFSRCKK